jgi:hypothetical protein
VVRGPAALLGLAVAALGYFLVAPALPAIRPLDLAIAVAAAVGLAFVVALAVTPTPAIGAPFTLVPAVLGSGLLVAALNAARAGAVASPFEALLFGCLGVVFAAALDAPALVIALPLFVAAIDASGALGAGPGNLLVQDARPGDPLTLELPAWGGGIPVARVTIAEVLFLAAYVAYAHRFGLRPWASAAAMHAALAGAVVLGLLLDRRVPALAVMSGAFLVANADRLASLLLSARER